MADASFLYCQCCLLYQTYHLTETKTYKSNFICCELQSEKLLRERFI